MWQLEQHEEVKAKMEKSTPPPPPPENREAVADAPKKVWSKPRILRIEDGTLMTLSGAQPDPNENVTYSPMS